MTEENNWGGGLRTDWPPETAAIITCPTCNYRHGRLYMCAGRWALVEQAEQVEWALIGGPAQRQLPGP